MAEMKKIKGPQGSTNRKRAIAQPHKFFSSTTVWIDILTLHSSNSYDSYKNNRSTLKKKWRCCPPSQYLRLVPVGTTQLQRGFLRDDICPCNDPFQSWATSLQSADNRKSTICNDRAHSMRGCAKQGEVCLENDTPSRPRTCVISDTRLPIFVFFPMHTGDLPLLALISLYHTSADGLEP